MKPFHRAGPLLFLSGHVVMRGDRMATVASGQIPRRLTAMPRRA
jgi:hypothetical protein